VKRPLVLVATLIALLGVGACGPGPGTDAGAGGSGRGAGSTAGSGPGPGSGSGSGSGSSSDGVSGSITVFAAASLKRTFTELGTEFEEEHPGATVSFSFAGSSDLVAQIQQGAPADVFASADPTNMARANGDGLVAGSPQDFATNTLQIAVPPGNPARVASFADLAKPGVKVVVCAPAVPCGSATAKVETTTGVDLRPVSEEQSVTDVLGKVIAGEADAGLVYVTDVKGAAGKVEGVDLAQAEAAVNTYPIAVLRSSRNAAAARAFVALVTGARGQSVLAAAGFGKP